MKKLISLFLSLVLALSLVPTAFAAEIVSSAERFSDVEADAPYLSELDYAVANGYIAGTSATTFSPDSPVTRGQFVTILGRMMKVDADNGTTWFTDVPETAFYAPYVGWAASNRYVNGTSSTTFAPDASITFEQMGTILANYLANSGVSITAISAPVVYSDAASVSGWAKANMDVMAQYNLLPTDASGNVSPRKAVTRAEATVALVRLAKSTGLGEEPTIIGSTTETPTSESGVAAKKIHDELWASGALKATMTEKEKAIVYYDWMCENCVYGTGTAFGLRESDAHHSYGALVNRVAVCDGLSYGYKMLLDLEGIECECIPDYKENHMFVDVVLDGSKYTLNVSGGVECSKTPRGEYDPYSAKLWRDKNFFPDEWESSLGTPMD